MKKTILFVALVFFTVPQVVSAVWWNPFTWEIFGWVYKPKIEQNVVSVQTPTPVAPVTTTPVTVKPEVVPRPGVPEAPVIPTQVASTKTISAPSQPKGPQTENEPIINISKIQYNGSTDGTYSVQPSGQINLQTKNNSTKPKLAWITFALKSEKKFNFVYFEVDFTSEKDAQGLLGVYVDGKEAGSIDERYYFPASHKESFQFGLAQPGTHTISFRLDQFGDVSSSVVIKNVGVGLFYIVDETGNKYVESDGGGIILIP